MAPDRDVLMLIDGHALAYRQYFAPFTAHLATAQGEPTNATFGFARTLLDILEAEPPPKYLAVAFDQGMSQRETLFAEYKSTRAKMEDSLIMQMDRIRQIVETFNIPILEKEGFEADDVIGAVAQLAVKQGVDVHIVTGDKDLLQLVTDQITVELPGVRSGDVRKYDPAGVLADLGVRPDQVVDYKGLVGDNSDHYPGVPGIGEKTAVPLLAKYEHLEGIYEHLDEQQGKVRTKLETGRDSGFLSRKLATILTDIPIDNFDLARCLAHDYDPIPVRRLFDDLEFRSLVKRLDKRHAPAAPEGTTLPEIQETAAPVLTPPPPEQPLAPAHEQITTVIVDSEDKLTDLVRALDSASGIAFDTETDSTDQMKARLVGISLAVNSEVGYYIPVGHISPDAGTLFDTNERIQQLSLERVIGALIPAMTDPKKPKYAHNAAFDLCILRRHGLDVSPISYDTMIAAALVSENGVSKGLKEQARVRLHVEMVKIEALLGKGKNQITMDRVPITKAAPYAAADAVMTYRLVESTRPDLEKTKQIPLFESIEMPLVPIIVDLNMTGALLDLPYLAALNREFVERLDQIKGQIIESVRQSLNDPTLTFNIGSLKQLNEILFDRLKLPTKGLGKSQHGFSLDAEALDVLKEHHPAVRLLLDWRSLEKLRNTYVEAMPPMVDAQGRIHTFYNQIGASTGRLSSEAPNLQNIPVRTEEGRRVRKAFIAPPGYRLLSVDYSQIELRILAHYSEDAALIEAFRQNQDIHRATAALVSGVPLEQVTKEQRYFAKRVNFGLMYGMGAQRLAREGELSRDEAKRFIDNYFQRLPGVKAYLDGTKERAREQGYLETMFGRRRSFERLRNPLGLRGGEAAQMEREAINMPIQGTNADIIKIAMVRLSARLKQEKSRARLILQVHDELVLEVPEDDIPATAALVRQVMESICELRAPLKTEAKVGLNWADMDVLA